MEVLHVFLESWGLIIYIYKIEMSVRLSVCPSCFEGDGGEGREGGQEGGRGGGDVTNGYDGCPGWTCFTRATPGHPASIFIKVKTQMFLSVWILGSSTLHHLWRSVNNRCIYIIFPAWDHGEETARHLGGGGGIWQDKKVSWSYHVL